MLPDFLQALRALALREGLPASDASVTLFTAWVSVLGLGFALPAVVTCFPITRIYANSLNHKGSLMIKHKLDKETSSTISHKIHHNRAENGGKLKQAHPLKPATGLSFRF